MNEDRFPERKNPRLKEFDYSTPNYYFITICSHQKKCIFGSADRLNVFGQIALDGMNQIKDHFPDATIDKCVVMPNHVHFILVKKPGKSSVSEIVGLYKSYVSRQIHKIDSQCKVWQTSFYDHVIRSQHRYKVIWNYIDTNPLRWEKDCYFGE